jgi:hypothetical protein
MLLNTVFHAKRHSLAIWRHRDARLGGELGVPVRKTDPAVFKRRDLEDFDALTFRVTLQSLGENGLKLFCGLAVSRWDGRRWMSLDYNCHRPQRFRSCHPDDKPLGLAVVDERDPQRPAAGPARALTSTRMRLRQRRHNYYMEVEHRPSWAQTGLRRVRHVRAANAIATLTRGEIKTDNTQYGQGRQKDYRG